MLAPLRRRLVPAMVLIGAHLGAPGGRPPLLAAPAALVFVAAQAAPAPAATGAGDTEEEFSERELQRRNLTIGMLLVIGIALVGLLMLAFVVIWGLRTRRLTRKPLPPTVAPDELWFLRGKSDAPPPPPVPPEREPGEGSAPPPPQDGPPGREGGAS